MNAVDRRGETAPDWVQHNGATCPVAPDQKVKVRYRNGLESDTILARERRWEAWPSDVGESEWDIVEWHKGRMTDSSA